MNTMNAIQFIALIRRKGAHLSLENHHVKQIKDDIFSN